MATVTSTTSNETLTGTAGTDNYIFNANWGIDSINDGGGTDTIDFSSIMAALTILLSAGAGDEVTDGTNTVNWNGSIIEYVNAGSGNDSITGNNVANTLVGNAGNDTLLGGSGNDSLTGGSGNDSLDGGADSDTYIFANDWGSDTIIDSSGLDAINMNAVTVDLISDLSSGSVSDGTNTISFSGSTIKQFYGGSGNDSIIGTSGDDVLLGGSAGNDTIIAGAGSDRISANAGDDYIDGGDGNERYQFGDGSGNDTIVDSSGSDLLEFFGTGNLTVDLSASSNQAIGTGLNITWTGTIIENVIGGSGNDTITGSSTNNTLTGSSGNDILYGGDGIDTLNAYGFTDSDSLDGGNGNDLYNFAGIWGNDSIIGDASGTDAIQLGFATGNYTVNLTTGAGDEVTDGISTVNWTGDFIENVNGGSGNDYIAGNASNNSLVGNLGSDTLLGDDGVDTLNGSEGNDSLDGGNGNDWFWFYNNSWGIDTITDASGTDTISFQQFITNNLTINLTSGAGDEVTDGMNTVNWSSNIIESVAGGSGNDTITGNTDANNLQGYNGNDTIYGGDGNDSLYGGTGNDRLDGQIGSDILYGGDGNDTYVFTGNWGADSISTTAIVGEVSGSDTVDLSSATAGLTVNLASGAGNEVTDGTNTVNWASNVIENVIGGSGNDTITGDAGNNSLNGGSGNDSIQANDGNDVLYVTSGYDTLNGGLGNDTYIFQGGSDADTIVDAGGNDWIDFSTLTFGLTISMHAGVVDGYHRIDWDKWTTTIENVIASQGDDVIWMPNNDNVIYAGDGNDNIQAYGGNDLTYGGNGNDVYGHPWYMSEDVDSGNDTFYGEDGNDTIYEAGGNDLYVAGNGNDYFSWNSYFHGGNNTYDGGAGNDIYGITSTFGSDSVIDASGYDEFWLGGPGAIYNAITGLVTNTSDYTLTWDPSITKFEAVVGGGTFYGADHDEVFTCADSSDSVNAGGGNDSLYGGIGNDTLEGGSGNDTLNGGVGNDTLSGGNGNDTYVFSNNTTSTFNFFDQINDSGSSGDTDTILLNNNYASQSTVALWFNGNDLQIGYTNSGYDFITVKNQVLGSASGIERIELGNGYYLTDSNINQVIQDMTTFAANNSISLTSIDDVEANASLMTIMSAAWHT